MKNTEHWDKPHYVYRCYDSADRLLYVGMTYNPQARMRQHSKKAPWFPDAAAVRFLVFPNRKYAALKERAAIVLERPIHNKTHRYWSPIQVGHTNDYDELRDLHPDDLVIVQRAMAALFAARPVAS